MIDRPRSRLLDVARAAGVSAMTVSRAMRGVDGVSEETRERILRIAQEMHYIPDVNARATAASRSNLIGVSLPTLFNDVFADMLLGMRRTFEQAGYHLVVNTADYDPAREMSWVSEVLAFRPAALVLTGCDHAPGLRRKLRDLAIPTLEIWDVTADPIDICVGIDHWQAGFTLGTDLTRLGYRRPGFVGTPVGIDPRADRRAEGIAAAFAAEGGAPLRRVAVHSGNAFVDGAEGYGRMAENETVDVVFFLNDHLAFGGLSRARQMGHDVPGRIGIVGFNRLDLLQVLDMRITTMESPRRQIGLHGARNLILRLNGIDPPSRTSLPCQSMLGDTTRIIQPSERR